MVAAAKDERATDKFYEARSQFHFSTCLITAFRKTRSFESAGHWNSSSLHWNHWATFLLIWTLPWKPDQTFRSCGPLKMVPHLSFLLLRTSPWPSFFKLHVRLYSRAVDLEKVCALAKGSRKGIMLPWYYCYTCSMSNDGCCSSCIIACHQSHIISYAGEGEKLFLCDCGQTRQCTIRH